ncbi:unnamed protein product [Sphagnum balticum]
MPADNIRNDVAIEQPIPESAKSDKLVNGSPQKGERPVISISHLKKSFNGRPVLKDINFEVYAGETLGIIGPSGCGKSTILKLLCGLIEPDSGEIVIESRDIGLVFQSSALLNSLTVRENLELALRERKMSKKDRDQVITERLSLVGLGDYIDAYPSALSGGQQKRVGFARAIVTDPKIILYDEPTTGLDPVMSTVIEDYMIDLENRLKAACIVVTHQYSTWMRTADRMLLMHAGLVEWEGKPEDALKSDNPYMKQFSHATKEGPILAGAKYVEITLPEKAGPPMTADTQDVYGEDPVRIEVVINPLAKQLGAFDLKGIEDRLKRDLDHIDVMANSGSSTLNSYRESAPELHRIATALNKVAVKADKAAGSADTFFQNGSRLANDMRGTTARANRILENPALSSDLKETATQARLTAEKIQAVMKDINKTLGDSKVRGDVLDMLQKLQMSAASIQQSIDRVGTISDDKGLRSDLKEIVTKTNTALDKVNDVVSQPTFGADLQGTLGKVRNAAEDLDVAAKNINTRVTSKHWLRSGAIGGELKNPAKVEEKKTTTTTVAPGDTQTEKKFEKKTESKTD